MLFRTSSHLWGSWYLPVFLFRDGLLTLMYIASFISLMRLWSSLPVILKLSSAVVWPVMLLWSWIGEGALRCSLNLSPNVLADSPIYIPHHIATCHTCTCIWCHSFCYGIFIFRCHQEVFDCFAPSKVDLYAMLLTYVFEVYTEASCVCYCYVISSDIGLAFVVCSILILVVCFWYCRSTDLHLNPVQGPPRILAGCKTFCRCSCSSSRCCLVKHTSLALWNNVLMTLYLADMT